jgi:hypothetical protein
MRGMLAAMSRDEPQITWLMTSQRGVLSRTQALSAFTPSALQHRIRPGGQWQRLLPGVYLTTTGEPTWDQRQMAAMLYAGQDSLITGLTALRNYKIRAPETDEVDVLVPASRQRTSRDFAVLHRTRRMPDRETCDLALRFAPVSRAVADAVSGLSELPDARTVVASAVQQGKCTVEELAAELAAGPVRGSARLRAVLTEVADGIRSTAEADLRQLILGSSLPVPLFNPVLFLNGDFLAQPDAWWPAAGVVAEVDSREWHLLPSDWERTMSRDRRMAAAGINRLHFSPHELGTAQGTLIAQIQAALRNGRPVTGISWQPAAA